MKNIKIFLVLLLTFSYSFGQTVKKNNFNFNFQPGEKLMFVLDSLQFIQLNNSIVKSSTSDFTVSGYYVATGSFPDLLKKAKNTLIKTYSIKENDLFIKKIGKPYFEGNLVFATNGVESSCIYVFKASKGYGWATMTFNHNKNEADKIDLILASIKENKTSK